MKQFYMQLSVWWETPQNHRVAKFKGLALVFFLLCTAQTMQAHQIYTFEYTGAVQNWVVPAGVSKIKVEAWGAQGGSASANGCATGGLGGHATGKYDVTVGQVLKIYVGGAGGAGNIGGFNGGGLGNSADPSSTSTGGGASDIRIGAAGLSDRILVAGGGGGAEYHGGCIISGGSGGGLSGSTGTGNTLSNAGRGGSQTAGGLGGPSAKYENYGTSSAPGTFGVGGNAAKLHSGGGGWYGGGSAIVTLL
jgi:hypothetical protein